MTSLQEALEHGRGAERSFRCHVHSDTNASASVNSATGLWICYACGARGRADLPEPTHKQLEAILNEQKVRRQPLPPVWLTAYTANAGYWISRFSSVKVARAFGFGTHPISGNPTFPVFSFGGDLLGCGERTGEVPKYRYPYGFRASESFGRVTPWFADNNGSDPYGRTVILVEGLADAAYVLKAGHTHVLACWGSSLHVPQAQHLLGMGVRRLMVGFDDDEAGERGYKHIVTGWGEHFDVFRINWGVKDPGELDERGIDRALGRALSAPV